MIYCENVQKTRIGRISDDVDTVSDKASGKARQSQLLGFERLGGIVSNALD